MTLLDSETGPASERNPAEIPARLDRLPVLAPHLAWIAPLTVNLGLGYYDNALFAYVTPAIVEHAGSTVGQVGLASSFFFVGMVIGGLFGGRLADRFGRRSIMVWGTATCSLGVIATGLAPSFETILVSRTVTGIGVQASMSALLVYIVEMFPAATRGRFVSIATSAFVIVAPIVALLALVTVPASGPDTWRHLFLLGGIGLLIAPAAHFLMPESVRWHISRDQVGKAEQIVAKLETRALIISVGNIGGALSGVLGAALYGAWAGAGVMITAAVAFVAFSIVILIFGPRTTNRPLEGVTAEELHAA
ncbi:MFS transporter [Nocardia amikacinitolerans]|uniref:MFS transporter n=1 Tax=Nocardia amikacinitolerans TaxID=756689 RepID=UPI0020A27A14|nr:MFS transporter [Nocardia amikacinitolerans]MCP2279668.1 Major Facilitator Superfamily protein [Nocardia amikacinitolerans]